MPNRRVKVFFNLKHSEIEDVVNEFLIANKATAISISITDYGKATVALIYEV